MSNWFNGLMGDALGGFLSGGMMSAFSRPIQSLGQYRNQNNNALDAAIQETMKPTQELNNLNNAIDGLFAQNKTAELLGGGKYLFEDDVEEGLEAVIGGIVKNLRRGTLGLHTTIGHEDYLGGYFLGKAHFVGYHHHGHFFLGQLPHGL